MQRVLKADLIPMGSLYRYTDELGRDGSTDKPVYSSKIVNLW